jgi:hypothetical protein
MASSDGSEVSGCDCLLGRAQKGREVRQGSVVQGEGRVARAVLETVPGSSDSGTSSRSALLGLRITMNVSSGKPTHRAPPGLYVGLTGGDLLGLYERRGPYLSEKGIGISNALLTPS